MYICVCMYVYLCIYVQYACSMYICAMYVCMYSICMDLSAGRIRFARITSGRGSTWSGTAGPADRRLGRQDNAMNNAAIEMIRAYVY